jgi:hypothetical protein
VTAREPVDRGDRRGVEAAGDQHHLRRVAGHGRRERLVDRGERGGVPARDLGGGAERTADLGELDAGGHLDDDGAARLLVEGEDVDAGDRLGGHQAQARMPELRRESLPGRDQQREQLGTVGIDLRDEPAGLRGHQGVGRLVDTQHS